MKFIICLLVMSIGFSQTEEKKEKSKISKELKEALEQLEELKELESLEKLEGLESLKSLESLRSLESLQKLEKLQYIDKELMEKLRIDLRHVRTDLKDFNFQFKLKDLEELRDFVPDLRMDLESLKFNDVELKSLRKSLMKEMQDLDEEIEEFENENNEIMDQVKKQHPNFSEGIVTITMKNGEHYEVQKKGESYRIKKLKNDNAKTF